MRSPGRDRAGVAAGLMALVGVIAIAAVAGGLYYFYVMENPEESVYALQEGDFVEYTLSENTYRIEVVSVGASTITVNYTMNIGGVILNQERELPADQTLMLEYRITDPPPGYEVTLVGKENLNTAWGQKSVDHFRVSYEQGGHAMLMDMWLLRGVPLRMQVTYEGHPQGFTNLTDTNLSFITS